MPCTPLLTILVFMCNTLIYVYTGALSPDPVLPAGPGPGRDRQAAGLEGGGQGQCCVV